jgi:hypothetical protein
MITITGGNEQQQHQHMPHHDNRFFQQRRHGRLARLLRMHDDQPHRIQTRLGGMCLLLMGLVVEGMCCVYLFICLFVYLVSPTRGVYVNRMNEVLAM